MFSICVIMFSFFPFFESSPDSVEIYVTNNLKSTAISSMYYLTSDEFVLQRITTVTSIQPDSTVAITVPSLNLSRIIFEGDDNSIFLKYNPAFSSGDTVTVSLASKEFGFLFDRIFGSYPVVVRNSSLVSLSSVTVSDLFFESNLLQGRILLPGELLYIWMDSAEIAEITATDINGNISSNLTCVASQTDTLFHILPSHFYHNGTELGLVEEGAGYWVVNCISDEQIVLVEVFDTDGFLIGGVDCFSSPLQTWDRVYLLHYSIPVSYIVGTDLEGRTYSLMEPDSQTDEYLMDMLSLDFGFGFPK